MAHDVSLLEGERACCRRYSTERISDQISVFPIIRHIIVQTLQVIPTGINELMDILVIGFMALFLPIHVSMQ
jgi:hypothetical protein